MNAGSRWADYYINANFEAFWAERLRTGAAAVCVILGLGFDPRALLALECIERVAGRDRLRYVALMFRPPRALGQKSDSATPLSRANIDRLSKVSAECLLQEEIALYDASGYATGGRAALQAISKIVEQLAGFRDVVVDISGMPRSIFYPLIAFLCHEADRGKLTNLHIAVSEAPHVDRVIRGREYAAADFIHTFRLQLPRKVIWLPVIAENEGVRLQRVHELLGQDCVEICPITPFPSSSLRRGDEILMNLRDVLFGTFAIVRDNILMCDEGNPFDIYRKILQIHDYYRDRLADLPELREITAVVSPLSSKMLSLGALLAAIERQLPVCHVGARTYSVPNVSASAVDTASVKTTEIWLTGEPYEGVDQI